MKLACLTVHAEKLHESAVWWYVRSIAEVWAASGRQMTFFIHPFWALAAGIDIKEHSRILVALGHEIGQHTHYYDRLTGTRAGYKRTDLSDDNIVRRLDEDYSWLVGRGIRPVGFVSGGWAFPPALVPWLSRQGFIYDCSLRSYEYEVPTSSMSVRLVKQPFRLNHDLLEVPTTLSLSAAAYGLGLGRSRTVIVQGIRYRLLYLHDHDLLDRRKRFALRVISSCWAALGWRFVTGRELAARLRDELGGR